MPAKYANGAAETVAPDDPSQRDLAPTTVLFYLGGDTIGRRTQPDQPGAASHRSTFVPEVVVRTDSVTSSETPMSNP